MQPSQSPSPSPSMTHQQQLTSLLSPLLGMSSLQVQQPSSLAAHIPQKTKQSITGGEFVELDCPLPVRKLMPQYKYLPGLSISFEFWEQTGQCSHTPLQEKKPTLTPSTGGCLLLQFTAQSFWPLSPHRAGVMFAYQETIWLARHKLTGFAWLCYYIDFSLFVGVGTIFLMVAPFLPLGQLPPAKECAIISTVVPNPAKTPAPSATAARSVVGITPPTKPGWSFTVLHV